MRIIPIALFAFLACAVSGLAQDKDTGKDERAKLEGTWQIVGLTAAGKEVPNKGGPEKLTVKGGILQGLGSEMELTTDATKKPKWLDMTFQSEGQKRTVHAIYELNGDELKICFPLAPAKGSGKGFENKRPEGFDSKDKPELVLKLKKAK